MILDIFKGTIHLFFRFISTPIPLGYGLEISIVNVIVFGFVCFLLCKLIKALTE